MNQEGEKMHIKDFMITDVVSVTENTTIKELLATLVSKKIGGVPVVDRNNKLLGMISDGDVLRSLKPKGRTVYDMFSLVLVSEKEAFTHKLQHTLDQPVSTIMRKRDIQKVNKDNSLEEALAIFSRHHFKKLPVVDKNNTVLGVISRGDLLRYIVNQLIDE